jgi:23S rRNA (guanosine2251-2'-O)-methyltransferase
MLKSAMKQNKIYIYGKHALIEALTHAPEVVDRVFLSKDETDEELMNVIKKAGVVVSSLGSDKEPKKVEQTEKHQGIIGRVLLDKLVRPYEEFVHSLKITPDTSLLLLGEIQDPQNVGAVIRSAAAFGVSGVIIPEHNQAPITGSVVKVSAGMAFRVPLVAIGNVNLAIRDLKKLGFWVYGLDGEATQTVSDESFSEPTVFVLGNEASGLRQKTREICDALLSVPINPKCESLNAAASAAVALYAWSLKHPKALS